MDGIEVGRAGQVGRGEGKHMQSYSAWASTVDSPALTKLCLNGDDAEGNHCSSSACYAGTERANGEEEKANDLAF